MKVSRGFDDTSSVGSFQAPPAAEDLGGVDIGQQMRGAQHPACKVLPSYVCYN